MKPYLIKIIMMDDDETFLTTTKALLEVKGYEVDAVTSIARFFQNLKRNQYDIAIIDLKMPGLTEKIWGGMDAISVIIRIDPLIQIIVLTGFGSEERKIEAINRGAFSFVEKRVSMEEELNECIRFAMASRKTIFSRGQMVNVPFRKEVLDFLNTHQYEKNVFIMMRYYEDIDIFKNIEKAIKESLNQYGFIGHLAKDKVYSSNLWNNVRIYMHSCSYGIGVFEQIKNSDFNPNISLELGYMYAMSKECLLLKDKRLPKLPADICGEIYKDFDYEKISTLKRRITEWVKEKK